MEITKLVASAFCDPFEEYAHQIGTFSPKDCGTNQEIFETATWTKETSLHLDSQHKTCGLPKIDAHQLNEVRLGVVVLFVQHRWWWRWHTHTCFFSETAALVMMMRPNKSPLDWCEGSWKTTACPFQKHKGYMDANPQCPGPLEWFPGFASITLTWICMRCLEKKHIPKWWSIGDLP